MITRAERFFMVSGLFALQGCGATTVVDDSTKHSPRCDLRPENFPGLDSRFTVGYYYDHGRCDNPADQVIWPGCDEECRARNVPFRSIAECELSCMPPVECGPDNPCATVGQTCVWVSSEARGYCTSSCQDARPADGVDFWEESSPGRWCPSGLICSAVAPGDCYPCLEHSEACVLPE